MSSESSRGVAIRVEGGGKCFRLKGDHGRTMKGAVIDLLRRRRTPRDFWALRDVTFQVRRGETLGIIGFNGAGKSTLLSLLAGTKRPTTGVVETHGTVSSLLELGAGFHPDLTGRENVFLAGAIMGIPRRVMQTRFDAIVAFAGIGAFIDQPVKHYSSGMYVRLGFAVAVEVDPDILLIDEVLSVGDANFQRKCIDKMSAFRDAGKTMLIISHDLPTIQSISDRILLLEEGRVLGIGDPEEQVSAYQSLNRRKSAKALEREWGTGEVKLTHVAFYDDAGRETDKFQWGQGLQARIHYEAARRIDDPVFGFALATEAGLNVYGNNTQIEGIRIPVIEGRGEVRMRLPALPMAAGTYLFSFSVHSGDHKVNYHRLDNRYPIAVESDKSFEGVCYMPVEWGVGP